MSFSHKSCHFWSSVKRFRKKNSTVPPLLSHYGSLVYSDLSKANLLNVFFSSCFNTSLPPLNSSSNPVPSSCPPDLLCSTDTVLHLLLSLPINTATGSDGISSRFHKIYHSLHCTCPSDWKCSQIVPVPKTNSHFSSSHYRPISLLSISSKILERHISDVLSVGRQLSPRSSFSPHISLTERPTDFKLAPN